MGRVSAVGGESLVGVCCFCGFVVVVVLGVGLVGEGFGYVLFEVGFFCVVLWIRGFKELGLIGD